MKHLRLFKTNADYESAELIKPNVSYVEETKIVSYDPVMPDMRDNYLTMVALEDGLTAKLSLNACEYCVDGDGIWKQLPADTQTEVINTGQTLSFRGKDMTNYGSFQGIGTFSVSKKFNLKGNCMSLHYWDDASLNDTAPYLGFVALFAFNENLIEVSKDFLPATTLISDCYKVMFANCPSLITPPDLPATNLTARCYSQMFYQCTSLKTAPLIHATTLAYSCCYGMFYECKSLLRAPELYSSILPNYCYSKMFYGCEKLNYIKIHATELSNVNCLEDWVNGVSTTGTFVKASNMHLFTVNNTWGIPAGWETIDFGEVPPLEEILLNTAMIYGNDKRFYTASQWTSFAQQNTEAIGVAISDGVHSFVVYPFAEYVNAVWSNNTTVEVPSVVTTSNNPCEDFAGESNTAAILAAVQAGTIADAPAAQYAASITFANGKKGYLPSVGELYLIYKNRDTYDKCMEAIGGTKFAAAYWSSTQISAEQAWRWSGIYQTYQEYSKDIDGYSIALASL